MVEGYSKQPELPSRLVIVGDFLTKMTGRCCITVSEVLLNYLNNEDIENLFFAYGLNGSPILERLRLAFLNGSLEEVRHCIREKERDADVNAEYNYILTLYFLLCCAMKGDSWEVGEVLSDGICGKVSHLEMVKSFVTEREDDGMQYQYIDTFQFLLLHAVKKGYFDIVKSLSHDMSAEGKVLALFIAIREGQLDIVKLLSDKVPGQVRESVFFTAARKDQLDIVKFLFDKVPGRIRGSVFLIATREGQLGIVKFLFDKVPGRIRGSVFLIATREGQLDIVEFPSDKILNLESKLRTVDASMLAITGVAAGIAMVVYLEMPPAVGIGVVFFSLVVAASIYYCNKPSELLENSNAEVVVDPQIAVQNNNLR